MDQVVVISTTAGCTTTRTPGGLCTFQDPNYMDSGSTSRMRNLTGATTNIFGNDWQLQVQH
jgi:hypothetical protein